MGTSGNPAKKAAEKKTVAKKSTSTPKAQMPTGPSSVADFKKRKQGVPLPLPSGLVVRARRVELQTYLKKSSGDVYNPLMGIVGEALEKGQMIDPVKAIQGEEGNVNLEKLNDMYEIVNGMVMAMCVDPVVYPEPVFDENNAASIEDIGQPIPLEDDARDEDLLYIDEFDDEDKMFLFQWAVGGTDDVARFREEALSSMDALAKESSRP